MVREVGTLRANYATVAWAGMLSDGRICMMSKTLLIVDDDDSIRASLKRVLDHIGYNVILAADGVEAQARLRDSPIDLIVLDLNMPRRDGWDVLEDAGTLAPLMPVIIVTGFRNELATYRIPGVDLIMSKPVDVQSLLDQIHRLITETPAERALRMDELPDRHRMLESGTGRARAGGARTRASASHTARKP